MINDLPARFAQVRIAVALLGEAKSVGWWSCSFLAPNGIAVAAYNFPRAPAYAALIGTTAAAKRLHDERIGKRRCVHLFRFALGDEMLIQRAIQLDECELLKRLPKSSGEAMKALEAEAGEIIFVEPGPVQVGITTDAFSEPSLKELAKHYLAAFRQDVQCLPYFANLKK